MIKWKRVETIQALHDGEIQLWRIDLPNDPTPVRPDTKLLITAEREHAARLRDGETQDQFIFGRSALRVLLGTVLHIDPLQVSIQKNRYGKPELAHFESSPIFFNVAHSGRTVLIALTRLCAVGVDIEHLDREVNPLELARHSFARQEVRQLALISDPQQLRHAFFRCWTRKEAIVKADGRGLSLPLSSFSVPIDLAEDATICVPAADGEACRSVLLRSLSIGNDMAGALALLSSSNMQPGQTAAFQFPPDILW